MASICFTNCWLPQEDGSLLFSDLWVNQDNGTILDAQNTFYSSRKRPARIIDLAGHILSPGFLDIQINGAYGFDFSIYDDDQSYTNGLKMVSERIVETGVTSLLPTIITQERSLYPKLLSLLSPHAFPASATLLGWHAEGPFLQLAKRGAHAQPFLVTAPNGIESFEDVYGKDNLKAGLDGVRVITAAPEIEGVMDSIKPLAERDVIFSIGHSIASSKIATTAVLEGARLITHLFNAMPQLHHRDPAIIGLLGAGGPYSTRPIPSASRAQSHSRAEGSSTSSLVNGISSLVLDTKLIEKRANDRSGLSEALDDQVTPPQTPQNGSAMSPTTPNGTRGRRGMHMTATDEFERPFYGLIVDGVHSHPNSVRLAYTAHPEGCILVTDAMSFLNPHLPDGVHEWRDNRRVVKQGDKLFIEGTDTLAGSVVTLDSCVRNFSLFTSTPLSAAIRCATYNPAKCLGIENKKGTLRPGADADLVVLDKEGRVLSTWVAGKEVWSASA